MATDSKTVLIGKGEALLLKWLTRVREDEGRKMSLLAKQALMSFITTGEYLTISKIHFNPAVDIYTKNDQINIYYSDFPEISEWIEINEKNRIKVQVLIREILKRSIEVVPPEEPEWIADSMYLSNHYFERIVGERCKTNYYEEKVNENLVFDGLSNDKMEKLESGSDKSLLIERVLGNQVTKTKKDPFSENTNLKKTNTNRGLALGGTRIKRE